ncbi:FHA domain-containing protein [bacterium]|nr:FHA domain-containing protein [bacterium]
MEINFNKNIKISNINENDIRKDSSPQVSFKGETAHSALNVQANYNIAYAHLSDKVDFDSRNNIVPIPMIPSKRYYISPDAKLRLGHHYILDLKRQDVQDALNSSMSVFIGRKHLLGDELFSDVSKQHLMLQKYDDDTIIAADVNSTFGTTLLPSEVEEIPCNNFILESGKKYFAAPTSVFNLSSSELDLTKYQNKFRFLKPNKSLIVGRNPKCDIVIPDSYVSGEHLKITKSPRGRLIVEDLNSTNGTKFIGLAYDIFKQDCPTIPNQRNYNAQIDSSLEKLSNIAPLKPKQKCVLPPNSQLLIGDDYIIDLRNPYIQKLLRENKSITIGSSHRDNVYIGDFHSNVAEHHITLQKDGNKILATQNKHIENPTWVIPQNQIRPFMRGAKNIELSQANIGDCYLLSSIYSLSKTDKGAQMLENMVSADKDGGYTVKFHNYPPIKVGFDELDGQWGENGQLKYSVKGDLGVKAIERAYGKMLKEKQRQQFSFPKFNTDKELRTLFADIDDGGNTKDTLYNLTGIRSENYYPSSARSIDDIFNKFRGIRRENRFMNCCAPPGKYDGYVDRAKRFPGYHIYSIGNIDFNKRMVEVINPHNTKRPIFISWDEFKDLFSCVTAANL